MTHEQRLCEAGGTFSSSRSSGSRAAASPRRPNICHQVGGFIQQSRKPGGEQLPLTAKVTHLWQCQGLRLQRAADVDHFCHHVHTIKQRWGACLPRRAGFKKQNSLLIQIDRRAMIWYRFTERQIQVDFLPHNSYKIRKSYCESLLCLSFVCGRPLLTAVGAEHRSRKGNLETAFIESRSVFIQGCTFLKPFN